MSRGGGRRGPHVARPRRDQGGFTLVEILVTVIITMIGLLGLMATFTASSRGSLDSRRTDQALALTEGAIEEIKQRTVAEIELANSAITATGWTVAYGAAIAGPSGVGDEVGAAPRSRAPPPPRRGRGPRRPSVDQAARRCGRAAATAPASSADRRRTRR